MKKSILTKSEHDEICTFLDDIMNGRTPKITPSFRRLYKQIKNNILVLRNHYGIIETMLDYEDEYLTKEEG